MKPAKLRQLLSEQGEVQRLYCAPEDASARRARKQRGGNTGKMFTEGWVEFADKRVAKQARRCRLCLACLRILFFLFFGCAAGGRRRQALKRRRRRRPPSAAELAAAVARLLPL
jgi:hypothetical protein